MIPEAGFRGAGWKLPCVLLLALLPCRLPAQAAWRPLPELNERTGHAMAYDPIRKRVVLFGGFLGPLTAVKVFGRVYFNDTWEWDGKAWQPRRPLHSPSPRNGHGMAYDPVGKRVLLFGGTDGQKGLGDTWAWDGQDWTRLQPRNAPSARFFLTMATDPLRKRVVLFGGALGFWFSFGGMRTRDETWEWDGNNWIQRMPKTRPGKRFSHGSAYCAKSKRVVVWGGGADTMALADRFTWEWDGTDWHKHDRYPTRPAGVSMASDPASGNVVALLTVWSSYNETWEWNGQYWLTGSLWNRPSFHKNPVVVNDEGRKVVLLHGGQGPARSVVRDTWTRTGQVWKRAHEWVMPFTGPNALVHDSARDQFLVVGGTSAGTETWSFTDGRMRKLSPAKAPPSVWPTAVFHAGLQKVWLLGPSTSKSAVGSVWLWDGSTWSERPYQDWVGSGAFAYDGRRDRVVNLAIDAKTWEWTDKSGWQRLNPAASPPARSGHAMAFDALRGRTVLFGGLRRVFMNGTWEWDGRTWQEARPAQRPPPRYGHHMVYVPSLGGILLFGGRGPGTIVYRDNWLWDGKDWKQLAVPTYPADSLGKIGTIRAAAYDPRRQRVLGIYGFGRGTPGNSVWEFSVQSLRASQPYPRLRERFSLDVDLRGQAGRPFLLALSGASRPGIPLRPVPGLGTELLPLAPDALFLTSLQAGLVTILDANGKGSIPLAIPGAPSLLWFPFHAAGLALGPGPGLDVRAISNRVGLEVVQ